jgi:hypothetical protein
MKFLFLTNTTTTVIVTLLNLVYSNVATAFVPNPSLTVSCECGNPIVTRNAVKCHESNNYKKIPIGGGGSGGGDDSLLTTTTTTTSRGVFLSKVLSHAAMTSSLSLPLWNIPLASSALEPASGILLSQQPDFSVSSPSSSDFSLFQDDLVGFQIKAPVQWKKSEQTLPDRRKIVLFVNDEGTNNDPSAAAGVGGGNGNEKDLMFIAYTPVRDDFTSLSSFGSVDQVAQMTILPKGQIAGQDSESQMIVAEAKKNSYYFDYISKPMGQPKRHFRTIFTLIQGATGGAGSVLVTITLQTTEERYNDKLKPMFDEIMDSYATASRKK